MKAVNGEEALVIEHEGCRRGIAEQIGTRPIQSEAHRVVFVTLREAMTSSADNSNTSGGLTDHRIQPVSSGIFRFRTISPWRSRAETANRRCATWWWPSRE